MEALELDPDFRAAGRSTRNTAPTERCVSAGGKEKRLRPENYRFLQQEIWRGTGIVLDEDKHYLFEARLAPLLRDSPLTTLNELCAQLRTRQNPLLQQQVLEALTTNETFFFRDVTPFAILRSTILPELLAALPPQQPLRIWSAAASSGQEPYSIAMLLHELSALQRCAPILGTDLCSQVLHYAKAAKYVQFEVNRGLPAAYLLKYFKQEGLDWRLNDLIRKAVRFQQFDLRRPYTEVGCFHLILCRNVLIYFDLATKVRILEQLADATELGGYLLLGCAESVPTTVTAWERVSVNNMAVYRRR